MIKQYFNLTIMLGSALMVYSYCQNDTVLPPIVGCIIILSLLPRLTSAERQFVFFEHIPLSVIIIFSLITGWIWGGIFPAPESAGSPFPVMIAAVQSGTIFASLLIYLKPFTKRNLYYLTFCGWLIVASSINVVFTGSMMLLFCLFCLLSTAMIILHTTKKPQRKKHLLRYYRDFILFSTLLVMITTGLFYGISKSIVLIDDAFMNLISDYIVPRNYTHFLKINPRLHLGSPGRSAWDRRPVLEVTIPEGNGVYLKTQIFDDYSNGTWIESKGSRQNYLPDTIKTNALQGEMMMFTTFEDIIPSPPKITAAVGRSVYTKSEDNILYTEDEHRTRILKFALTDQNPSVELTQDKLNITTRLPPGIARQLKEISAQIVGGETNVMAKVILIREFFHKNFKYSLNIDYRGDDKGILKMLREKREAYCTYFASAMALLLRAEGIPARVAAGFLVTENIDKDKNKFLARVKNAHAWTEVLLARGDPAAGGGSEYTWMTFDPTPARALSDVLYTDRINFRALMENTWLVLLRFNAYLENTDKNKLKTNLLAALILIMVLINHKKIFAGIKIFLPRLNRTVPLRIKKPDKLQSIYRRYERYLKVAFNETRERADTDKEVVQRLKKRRDIPGATIEEMETFLGHYHAARFGEKESLHLEEMITSIRKKK